MQDAAQAAATCLDGPAFVPRVYTKKDSTGVYRVVAEKAGVVEERFGRTAGRAGKEDRSTGAERFCLGEGPECATANSLGAMIGSPRLQVIFMTSIAVTCG